MHHCTAPDSYFFQLKEWSSGGRAGCKCEGENLAITPCSLKPAALHRGSKHRSERVRIYLFRIHSKRLFLRRVTVLVIFCFLWTLIFISKQPHPPHPHALYFTSSLPVCLPLENHNAQNYSLQGRTFFVLHNNDPVWAFEFRGSVISLFSDLPVRTHNFTCWNIIPP